MWLGRGPRLKIEASNTVLVSYRPLSFIIFGVLARSSGEEPASPRHRAGVASMAWRMIQHKRAVKFDFHTQVSGPKRKRSVRLPKEPSPRRPKKKQRPPRATPRPSARPPCGVPSARPAYRAR